MKPRSAIMFLLIAIILMATGCGEDSDPTVTGDQDTTTESTSTIVDSPGGVPASIGGIIEGDVSGDINVLGYVVIDQNGTRFCSVLLESFPPQCGAPSVDLVDLDLVAIDLQEEQGVQWTDEIVILLGTYSDGTFTVLDVGEPLTPPPADTSEPQTTDGGGEVDSS